ncbi:MAG TPA: helix-turn-helix transcriptional regulator [Candidatus Levybacteria bacterium]|nr:helix-turn-helix transcriptional regulator [Candidatus Levybacteria bacterium]
MGKEVNIYDNSAIKGTLSFSQLSPRKKEILALTARGDLVPVIAEKIGGISVKTVDSYKRSIRNAALKRGMGNEVDRNSQSDLRAFSKRIITYLILDGIVSGNIHIEPPERELLPLTKQEIAISDLLSTRLSSAEIAKQLYFSHKTIEAHVNHLKKKMCAKNIYHLIARKAQLELTGEWDSLTSERFQGT